MSKQAAHTILVTKIIITDIDECLNSPCEHNCTNTVGSFVCSCPEKYIVANNGLTCAGKISSRLVRVGEVKKLASYTTKKSLRLFRVESCGDYINMFMAKSDLTARPS